MNRAVIALGSNINPHYNIEKSVQLLEKEFKVFAKSQFIQTKPFGYTDQDDFINGAVYLETSLIFNKLNEKLKEFELLLERKKSDIKFGPRTIDLDIIVFNEEIVDSDFYERDFLKKIVLEVMPDLKY